MEVVEISVKDVNGTEFVFLARDMEEALLLKLDIQNHNSVNINNVLIMKDGEVSGYVENALITLLYLDNDSTVMRLCKDDQPKFALID
jgi:hypothetical protein